MLKADERSVCWYVIVVVTVVYSTFPVIINGISGVEVVGTNEPTTGI